MRCFFCRGELTGGTTTHVVTLDNCIIIVKNVPCTRCCQCGESYFSDEVAQHLERIVQAARAAVTEIAVVNYADQVA